MGKSAEQVAISFFANNGICAPEPLAVLLDNRSLFPDDLGAIYQPKFLLCKGSNAESFTHHEENHRVVCSRIDFGPSRFCQFQFQNRWTHSLPSPLPNRGRVSVGDGSGNGRLTTDHGQPPIAWFLLPTADCLPPTVLYSPFAATKLIKSRTRQEYPHSLSYQATTFTSVPSITLVKPASIMDECGLPVKSLETSSSSTY